MFPIIRFCKIKLTPLLLISVYEQNDALYNCLYKRCFWIDEDRTIGYILVKASLDKSWDNDPVFVRSVGLNTLSAAVSSLVTVISSFEQQFVPENFHGTSVLSLLKDWRSGGWNQ